MERKGRPPAVHVGAEPWEAVVRFVGWNSTAEAYGHTFYVQDGRESLLVLETGFPWYQGLPQRLVVRPGDWIVKGSDGNFATMSERDFAEAYPESQQREGRASGDEGRMTVTGHVYMWGEEPRKCQKDGQDWPCDAVVLMEELTAMRARLRALEERGDG